MLRIAPVVVGVVVVGLGTSAPESLVSGMASAHGNPGIAVGNLVGSNIINLTLVLGVSALVAPIVVRSSVLVREAPMTVAATVAFGVGVLAGLNVVGGAVLTLLGAVAVVTLVRLAPGRSKRPAAGSRSKTSSIRRPDGPGCARRSGRCSVWPARSSSWRTRPPLAHRWGVSDAVIGFTLVALGTSLP